MTPDNRAPYRSASGPLAEVGTVDIILWSALGTAGLLFWFILGYPFHHHNESYVWAVLLDERGFLEATLVKMRAVANHRPLGQAVIWLTYRLSDGSVAPAQVFNIVIGLAAWLVPLIGLRQHRSLGIAALVSGGVLFSGYIYAFHLHGAFYSPVLVLTGFLIIASLRRVSTAGLIALTAGTAAAALFHPYALLLFLAWAFGMGFEQRAVLTRKEWTLLGVSVAIIAGLVFVLVILPGNTIYTSIANRIDGLHASYRSTEVHPMMTAVVALLTMVTIAGTQTSRSVRMWFAGATGIAIVASIWLGLPLLYVWVAASFVRMALQGRYALAATIACSAILPAIAPTGSPTYAVYTLMLCTVALVVDWKAPDEWLQKVPRVAVGAAVLAIVMIATMLRMGVHVPVLGTITSPIIAERERTLQLETVLAWWESSTYQSTPVMLGQTAPNPVDVKDKADRRYRPPTSQVHLEKYVRHRMEVRGVAPAARGELLVLFGGAESTVGAKVYNVPGDIAGPVNVYYVP